MIRKNTRDFLDVFLSGSDNSAVSCNDIQLTVNDDRIYKAELSQTGTELIDLLRGVGSGMRFFKI